MDNKKPAITRANDKEKAIEENWFSKTEIARMTGRIKEKRLSSSKVKEGINNVSKEAVNTARSAHNEVKKSMFWRRLRIRIKIFYKKTKNRILKVYFRFKRASRKTKVITVGATLVAILGLGYFAFQNNGFHILSDSTSSELLGTQIRPEVSFDTLTPDGSTISTERFDAERGVYQLETSVNNVRVVVSQQPLPGEVLEGTLDMKSIALSVPDSESVNRFEVDKAGLIYIVNQSGDKQSVVFKYNDELLVFLTAESRLTINEWVDFIDTLFN